MKLKWQNLPNKEDKRPVIMSLIAMIKSEGNRFMVESSHEVYKLASDDQIYNSIKRKFQRKSKRKKQNVVDPPPRKKGEEEW